MATKKAEAPEIFAAPLGCDEHRAERSGGEGSARPVVRDDDAATVPMSVEAVAPPVTHPDEPVDFERAYELNRLESAQLRPRHTLTVTAGVSSARMP